MFIKICTKISINSIEKENLNHTKLNYFNMRKSMFITITLYLYHIKNYLQP